MEVVLYMVALGTIIVLAGISGAKIGKFLKERRERILRGE